MKMSRQEFVKAVIDKFVRKLREIKDQEGVEYDSPIFNISENELSQL